MTLDTRPVIIGMNNPLSTDPRLALAPFPANSAGHRLWRMVNEQCGVSRAEYMRTFRRVNLLNETTWDPVAARRASEGLWKTLEGCTVVVVGQAVRTVLWLPRTLPLLWNALDGVRWCSVPHPSGLCREYNDELMRRAVGLRLEELYMRHVLDAE